MNQWLQQVSEAIRASTQNIVRYEKAAVLMLSWKDSDIKNTSAEFARLKGVFQKEYKYTVDDWQIPSEASASDLGIKAHTFAKANRGKNNLLIVYYAGHARQGVPAGEAPVWRSR
jgi:hypothetical protein